MAGRKIVYNSLDDGYSPPKTVDQVAFFFATIGTAANTAISCYTDGKGVPLLFLGSGANKWATRRMRLG